MNKKFCVVTGGNAGIGFQTALQLAKKDFAIIIVSRNTDKGQQAVAEIMEESGNQEVYQVTCDLSSQKSIRQAAQEILSITPKLDVLVNNAGTWYSKYTRSEDGIEMMIAVNHLAYFLLTHLLLGALLKSGQGRIINVGSDSHFQGKMHFEDLGLEKKYHGLRAYAQSKLANLLFTYHLGELLAQHALPITVNCVQPGLVRTDIGVKHTTPFHAFAWKVRRNMGGLTPEQGAATSVYLASSEEAANSSGKYWDKCQPKPSSKRSYRKEDAKRLWEMSLRLTDVKDYFALAGASSSA